MARYKLLAVSFIDNRLWQEGETIEVPDDFPAGPHMKPLDTAAKKRVKELGIEVGAFPDVITELTGGAAGVQTIGASPQGIRSGIAASEADIG
ncbi:MAG TPA: hypothetical protein VEF34_06245 [Syntrophobacteraceae bacterium]|nr:hypothetical protein [Syntrophobacteraceae bacterium]